MEIFYKGESSEYEEIVKCGPNWWTEYLEMNAVYQFEGWTLDLMISWLNRMVSNQFPMHADEATIRFFEQLMMINPEPGESLEQRRENVFTYYSGINRLSKSVIQSIMQIYTACNSEVWWENQSLHIRILCNGDRAYSIAKIVNAVERRLPAHLLFVIHIVLCCFKNEETFAFCRVQQNIKFSWSQVYLPFLVRYSFQIVHKEMIKIQIAKFGMNMPQDIGIQKNSRCRTHQGSFLANQMEACDLKRQVYRVEFENKEKISANIYIPNQAYLNGVYMLDGTIKLNLGREKL